MRDAQSIFDQAIAHGAGAVGADAVRSMLGLADRARVVDLFDSVMRGDAGAALAEFRAQYDTGADPVAVLTDLAEFVHLVTRFRFVPTAADDASLTETERKRGLEFAEKLSVRVLSRAWQMLLKGIPEVQTSNRPVSAGEMVLIRLAHAADLPTLDEAIKSLTTQGQGGQSLPRTTPALPSNGGSASASPSNGGPSNGGSASAVSRVAMTSAAGGGQAMRLVEPVPAPEAPAFVPPQAEIVPEVPIRSLADIAALAEQNRDKLFKINLKTFVRPVSVEPGRLTVGLADGAPKTLLGDLTARLKSWTGRNWLVSLVKEGGPTLAEAEGDEARDGVSGRPRRPGCRCGAGALSRRQDHRRAHSRRAGSDGCRYTGRCSGGSAYRRRRRRRNLTDEVAR